MFLYHVIITLLLLVFLKLVVQNLQDYRPAPDVSPVGMPLASILIPARNEAENIEACIQSIFSQEYGHLEILVLDDDSQDDTAARIERLASTDGRLRLLKGAPIEPGWAGKAWACHQLGLVAKGDWLLFVDADTCAQPGMVRRSVALAQAYGAGMVSAFPQQTVITWAERLVIPMIHWVLLTFLPIRQVWAAPSPAFAAACGQFELFSHATYRLIGGHEAVKGSFHDGLQLARKVKAAGAILYLFDGTDLITCRMYRSAQEVWNGFTRNAYEGIGSLPALVFLTALEKLLFLAPFVFLLIGLLDHAPWTWLCTVQVLIIYLMRTLLARRFGNGSAVPFHPLSVAVIISIQWASFFRSRSGRKGSWKGRTLG
ncbi:MAG: glycosyltransferase family 2 protein [Armatimonadota bacterium]|nr:glycosyltransferase family 2 protein [Armatimonadota bacterium]